jgi:hypothetical protein
VNFLCIVHVDGEAIESLSPHEREVFDRDNAAYGKWLGESGHAVAYGPLEAPETATLIRSRGGKLSMTDGPYVETKEHLGGFMLIRARDRAEALEVAGRSPVARVGTIEVREMEHLGPG